MTYVTWNFFLSEIDRTRMHSSRMCTTCSLPYRAVSVQEGLCLVGSLSRGGLCLGGLCLGGLCPRGYLSSGVSVQGNPPGQRPPHKEHGTRHRDPLEGTWDQTQRPPGRNMGPGRQTGSDIIRDPPPPPVDRMTDRQV